MSGVKITFADILRDKQRKAKEPLYEALGAYLVEQAEEGRPLCTVFVEEFNMTQEQVVKWCTERSLSTKTGTCHTNKNWVDVYWGEDLINGTHFEPRTAQGEDPAGCTNNYTIREQTGWEVFKSN